MKKKLLFIVFILIGVATITLLRINTTIFLENQKVVYDRLHQILNSTNNHLKQDVLSYNTASTQIPGLKEAILDNDIALITEILEELNDNLTKNFQSFDLHLQILTQDALYCLQNESQTLSLNYQNYYKKAISKVYELKSLVMNTYAHDDLHVKVISPIVHDNKIIALLEIKIYFDVLVQKLRRHNIEAIPLMLKNTQQEKITKSTIFENYIIANENYNHFLLTQLKQLSNKDFETLLKDEYLYKHEFFYAINDIKNMHGEVLGKWVLIINKQRFEELTDTNQSFLNKIITINNTSEDFYNFAKHKEPDMFLNIEKGYIKNLKDVVDLKDKTEFEEVAREKLLNLSKDELVDFILQQSKQSEIEGEIR